MSLDAGTEQIEATARSLAQARSLLHAQFAIDLVSDAPVPASDIVGTGVVWLLPSGREIVLRSGPGGFPVSADAPANPELFVQVGDGAAATRLGALDALNMLTVSITADQLAQFDELIVAVDAPDSAGSGSQVIARIAPPVEALAVAEALLATDGSLAQLNAQAQLVIDHIDLMQREIDGGTLRELRRHAEHVANLVEGASGEHFGDLDGDGVSQNPGDDIGVLAHLDGVSAAVLSLPQDTDEQAFYTAIWLDAIEIVRGHAVVVVDQALRVNATDSPAEAQPFVAGAFASGVSMLDGADADGNGVIEMFSGEFGIRSLDEQASDARRGTDVLRGLTPFWSETFKGKRPYDSTDAAGRHPHHRPDPGPGWPVLHVSACSSRRRGHQGRTPRWRMDPARRRDRRVSCTAPWFVVLRAEQ